MDIYCLCLGAFVAILSGLSGLGLKKAKNLSNAILYHTVLYAINLITYVAILFFSVYTTLLDE
jgi:hypothetical protein